MPKAPPTQDPRCRERLRREMDASDEDRREGHIMRNEEK
jgi:hypothetical protein